MGLVFWLAMVALNLNELNLNELNLNELNWIERSLNLAFGFCSLQPFSCWAWGLLSWLWPPHLSPPPPQYFEIVG